MTNTKRSKVRLLLIPPQFRRYVTRLRPPALNDETVDSRIIDAMIECLFRIRPRRQLGENDQTGIVRSQLDRETALPHLFRKIDFTPACADNFARASRR